MSPPNKAEAPLKSHDYRPSPHPNRPKFPHLDSSMKEIKNCYKYRDTFHGVEVDRPAQRPASHSSLRPKLMHQPISIRTLSGTREWLLIFS